MKPYKVLATLSRRFKSGNSVPIESTRITREEWDTINGEITALYCSLDKMEVKEFRDHKYIKKLEESLQMYNPNALQKIKEECDNE